MKSVINRKENSDLNFLNFKLFDSLIYNDNVIIPV